MNYWYAKSRRRTVPTRQFPQNELTHAKYAESNKSASYRDKQGIGTTTVYASGGLHLQVLLTYSLQAEAREAPRRCRPTLINHGNGNMQPLSEKHLGSSPSPGSKILLALQVLMTYR